MSANEISERIAAHAWLRLGPKPGNIVVLESGSVGFRSQVGLIERVRTTTDATTYPLLVLELDRELSRSQNQVLAYLLGSIDAAGRSYPEPVLGNGPRLPNVQPIHTSWIGNYTAPSWLPFTGDPVPGYAGRNLDLFNAVAILLQADVSEVGSDAYAGDVSVLVLQSPIGGPARAIAPVIPVPGPPGPVAKFYHFFGPGTPSAEGTVMVWPDTGDAPPADLAAASLPDAAASFDSSLVLNNLQTIVQVGNANPVLLGSMASYGEAFSFSQVLAVTGGQLFFYGYQVGGDVAGFILVGYDSDTGPGPYWFVETDQGQVILGNATVLAIAITCAADGTWSASFRRNWGAVETATGTLTQEAMTYQQAFGKASSSSTGNSEIGEIRMHTLTAWDASARVAELDALFATWAAPLPILRWYGPDLAVSANVASWVDQLQAADATNAFAPSQPSASVGLNGLVTLHGAANHPLYADTLTYGYGHGCAIAFVVVVPPGGAENLFLNLTTETLGVSLKFYTASGPGLSFDVYTDEDSGGFFLDESSSGTYAGVAWWDPSTGEMRATISKDWGPNVLIEQNFGFTWDGNSDVSSAGINASEPDPSAIVSQMAEFVVYIGPMSAAQQTAIVQSLRDTWEPDAPLP